ncbi:MULTISPECIES: ABC transporter family substrate-binding protein [unclassified Microbacterium]|uniref:ABC transporter family substrate-binding protein n=1 Tax=unclassified Microbacterium TaxID=2609290 RepID=UPI00301B4163
MIRTRSAKSLGALAMLGAAALLIAGCSAGNTAPSASESPSAALPTVDWDAAPAADVQDGGTLNLSVGSLPVNYNNSQIDGNDVDTNTVLSPTQGGPLKITTDGGTEVNPDYASSVELISDDPQVVEVKLNPKAVWEDGTPITVADYQATWKALNGSNTDYQVVSTTGWDQIGSVEQGTDEFDVKITFSSVFADWKSLMGGALPASVASDPTVFNTGYTSKAMPSSGPYVISNIDQTGQVITLTPNPKWWGDKPKLDTILFKVVSQAQSGSSFANKETDALEISASADLYATAKTRDDAELQATNGLTWTHVTMNAKSGPLSDVNVRKAVASVVNREQIAAAANTPVGVPAVTQGDYIFMNGQDGYQDKAYPNDPAAAEGFMKDAGYTKDGNSWTKDGQAAKLTITVPADTATNIQRAEQVQADLNEFGIPVDLTTVPAAQYFSDYVIPGNFEMATFSWQGTPYPISSSEAIFYPLDSGQNFTGTTDDKLGDMWTKANAELDPAKRIEIANEINEAIWAYVPMFPIAPLPNVWAVKQGLVNYGATMFGISSTVDWTIVGWKK